MRLVVTITDTGPVVYRGGDVERLSAIMTVPDEFLPRILKDFLSEKAETDPYVAWLKTAAFTILHNQENDKRTNEGTK